MAGRSWVIRQLDSEIFGLEKELAKAVGAEPQMTSGQSDDIWSRAAAIRRDLERARIQRAAEAEPRYIHRQGRTALTPSLTILAS